jgi:ATP adenylyltransferase
MDRLWSPWRYRYVSQAPGAEECIFCAHGASESDAASLILHRGGHNFVLLNLFPYTTGHLMVAPYSHVADLEDLASEAACEMMRLTQAAVRILRAVYRPQGFNAGLNLGACAGAGVAGHLHMHVLPRWTGDANFMTVVGETRVMPEDLSETWRKLGAAFRAGAPL